MNSQQQPGSNIDRPKNIEETLGSREKARKLKSTILKIYETGETDPKYRENTSKVLSVVKSRQWYENLKDEEKNQWHKKVREIIIEKLELPYKNFFVAYKARQEKKKNEEKKKHQASEDVYRQQVAAVEKALDDIVISLENYSFTSD